MKRSEVLEHRIHVQQLDRAEAERAIIDAAVFDFGVQDTGRDGASWALANRGVPVRDAAELEASPDVALAWTLRASPHYYRRADLPEVLVATSPLSDRDAAKRVVGAEKPLKEAGIPALAGLSEVATQLRHVVKHAAGQGRSLHPAHCSPGSSLPPVLRSLQSDALVGSPVPHRSPVRRTRA